MWWILKTKKVMHDFCKHSLQLEFIKNIKHCKLEKLEQLGKDVHCSKHPELVHFSMQNEVSQAFLWPVMNCVLCFHSGGFFSNWQSWSSDCSTRAKAGTCGRQYSRGWWWRGRWRGNWHWCHINMIVTCGSSISFALETDLKKKLQVWSNMKSHLICWFTDMFFVIIRSSFIQVSFQFMFNVKILMGMLGTLQSDVK